MRKTATFFNVIAMVAITWYICTYYSVLNNWWTLPLVAAIIAINAIFLPLLANRFKPLWSVTSTGISLLALQILTNMGLSPNSKIWCLFGIILIISVITDILVHGPSVIHVGELLLDCVIALASAWFVIKFSHPITTVSIMLVAFILVILFDFNCNLSIKGKSNDKDETIE